MHSEKERKRDEPNWLVDLSLGFFLVPEAALLRLAPREAKEFFKVKRLLPVAARPVLEAGCTHRG